MCLKGDMDLKIEQLDMRNRMLLQGLPKKALKTLDGIEVKPRQFTKNSVFYAIKVSKDNERRYKFGYSGGIQKRLKSYKTICPDCLVIRKYKCHPLNEKFVIELIGHYPGVLMLGAEVADVNDSKRLFKYLDAVFEQKDLTSVVGNYKQLSPSFVNY